MSKQEDKRISEDLPYEKILERLTSTVEALERGELTLEEQIKRFEEGVLLVRRGQTLLDEAERKVEVLLEGDSTASFESSKVQEEEGVPF